MTTRRLFIRNALAVLAAPVIVKAASLMPVRSIERFYSNDDIVSLLHRRVNATFAKIIQDANEKFYGDFAKHPANAPEFDSRFISHVTAFDIKQLAIPVHLSA